MKMVKEINLAYRFEPARKGAKYSINDGITWMNAGEFSEAIAKAAHGLNPQKDANTRYDQGSDIPEYNASVKSSAASLTNVKLGNTYDESIAAYFKTVASTEFWYVSIVDGLVIIYKMNATKFERFLRKFAKLNERGVIRIAKTSAKMLAWLDANA